MGISETVAESKWQVLALTLLQFHGVARVLRALEAAGIPVIVLKGAALAETVYPTLADRPMGDVDLLVRPADREQASAVLEAAGYRYVPEPQQPFSPFATTFTGEMAFRGRDRTVIELHWQLTPSEWLQQLCDLDPAPFWAAAQPLEVEGAHALQLAPHDLLLHLCVHLTVHGYGHGVGFTDIVQVVAAYQPFAWELFLARATRFRLRSLCYFPLEICVAVLGASVPAHVLAALRPPTWQRRLVRWIADPQKAATGGAPVGRARGYLLQVAVAERPIDLVRPLAWLLFPGPRWLAQRYRLRGQLRSWFACLWHPLVVSWHAAAGVGAILRAPS